MHFRLLFGVWMRLLREHGHLITRDRVGSAALLTFASACHSIQNFFQDATYRDALAQTRLTASPIFIIGHWRSGTTLLHELLRLDSRHSAPTTHACMNPSNFLITSAPRTTQARAKRPMDAMTVAADSPQEDEFALLALGAPSPYIHWIFPSALASHPEYLDLNLATGEMRERWKAIITKFLRQLTLQDSRRLIVKSPPHTFRVALLRETFPDAVFAHIVRDPYVVFASTRQMYRKMFGLYGLTGYSEEALDDYILANGELMERLLDAALPGLGTGQYCRIRYEDLVARPMQCVRDVYDATSLGAFEEVRPALQRYVEHAAGYQIENHELTPTDVERVSHHWRCMFEKYGYESRLGSTAQAA